MIDTDEYIRTLQLKIWLSKPPAERLRRMMTDNDALFKFWSNAKESNGIESSKEYDLITQIEGVAAERETVLKKLAQ